MELVWIYLHLTIKTNHSWRCKYTIQGINGVINSSYKWSLLDLFAFVRCLWFKSPNMSDGLPVPLDLMAYPLDLMAYNNKHTLPPKKKKSQKSRKDQQLHRETWREPPFVSLMKLYITPPRKANGWNPKIGGLGRCFSFSFRGLSSFRWTSRLFFSEVYKDYRNFRKLHEGLFALRKKSTRCWVF